jgi:hypothetical protein
MVMYQPSHLEFFRGTTLLHLEEFPHNSTMEFANPPEGLRRIWVKDDDDFSWFDRFDEFINSAQAATTTSLSIGFWDTEGNNTPSDEAITTLIAAKDRLPALKALFVGDMNSDERQFVEIAHGDLSGVLAAFPTLEHLCIRGGTGLRLSGQHSALKTLVIQSGGLTETSVQEVVACDFPNLKHLELWFGAARFGASKTITELAPVLQNQRFPKLHYLGLRNSQLVDEIAQAVINAPVVQLLKVLDLSVGYLTDQGGNALLQKTALQHLELLDLHYNRLSQRMIERLQACFGSIVDVSREGKDYRIRNEYK